MTRCKKCSPIAVLALVVGSVVFMGQPENLVRAQQRAGTALEEAIYKCDTPGIQLEGTLIGRMFYGPPGFGETPAKDVRDKVLVLKLVKPITVRPIEDAEAKNSPNLSTVKHVRQIQLFFLRTGTSMTDARKLLGKTVVVVGKLDEATAPGQYTDVTMDVKTLQAK